MFDDSNSNRSRARWTVPVVFCTLLVFVCLVILGLLVALIPLYLTSKNNANFDYIKEVTIPLSLSYASDLDLGRSLIVADRDLLSTQIVNRVGVSGDLLSLQVANFISMTPALPGSDYTKEHPIRCDKATGLTGDVFFAQFRLKYPMMCYSSGCRQDFLLTVRQSLRVNNELLPVVMNFTDGQARNVQLKFCTFIRSVPT